MLSLFETLKRAFARATDNNTGLLAAGIAYYGFLSFMPLLAAIVLTYGLLVDTQTVATHVASAAEALPPSAGELVGEQLESVSEARSDTAGLALLAAITFSLFGARVAAGSVISALNVAFEAEESRGIIRSNLLAIAITLGVLIALSVVGGATALVSFVLGGQGGAFTSYAVVGAAGIAGAIFAYRVVPNTPAIPMRAAFRGAILFGLGWMAASAGFGFYASNFASYNATYGSLGAIVVFLTWLYLSAYLLLIGAHLAADVGKDTGA
ncbi:YihY/virulence factor BrkB family protein [Erythrobacter sp. MTPC3]|uniref:YihY/virulence factor BrkB family protein n=1 Tax=Erythrobacter sp. MTPC3 TaxID=3056564 RepID=UPI0036F29F91